MTGLPGAGKSTLGGILKSRLEEGFGIRAELLDGDEIRKGLSRDLGLSKEDREEHARRVSFVAKLLSRNGVVPIVALISPYRSSRAEAKETIGKERFIETFIRTSLAECERRDPKGLYARARKGEITNMTGIQAPYEAPERPDLTIDTEGKRPEESADDMIEGLVRLGRLQRNSDGHEP